MTPETWQLDPEPLSWKLEELKHEPLEVLDFGELETLDYEPFIPLDTVSALGSALGSSLEIDTEILPK